MRTTPIYEKLKARNAVFGAAFGLEHALWFAPEEKEPAEQWSFRRNNAFEVVAEECRGVRERVGVMEIATYAKYGSLLQNTLILTGPSFVTPETAQRMVNLLSLGFRDR